MHLFFKSAVGALALATVGAGPAAALDARNPDDVLSVLVTNGASGEMKVGDDGGKFIEAKTGQLSFEVEFYKCNKEQNNCETVSYQLGFDSVLVNVDQINIWNRWTLYCPTYLTKENHPHIWMSVSPTLHDTRADIAAQQDRFLGCLSDFDKFTDNPENYIQTVIEKK